MKILDYVEIDEVVIKSDINHCKNTIEKLKINNECKECIESHERLLNYMKWILKYIKFINSSKRRNRMWKCKNCGGIEFEAQVGSVVFDEMGVILEVGDISNEVYCLECSSVGNRIDGIANWEEE